MDESILQTIQVIESIATIIAIIIGGMWVYFRFNRTREDHPKIQIDLNLNIIGVEGDRCLIEC